MKKVSAKLFFAVLWKGVCQVLGWFFGLFGYKTDGKFAKLVWGVFATSAAVVAAIFAIVLVTSLGKNIYEKHFKEAYCFDPDCNHAEFLAKNIYYHDIKDGRGYVFNSDTGEKTLRHVSWIAKPEGEDSLICFCDGKKRGYFSKNTGNVVITAKYDHAWVFSEGFASVVNHGSVSFIDGNGQVVIDNVTIYRPGMDGLFFHDGYCIVDDVHEISSLIDKKGNIVLQEYGSITRADYGLWKIERDGKVAIYDKDLRMIIPLTDCSIWIGEGAINMAMNDDHTMRKYDLQGGLINDFYIANVRSLEYDKDEILYRKVDNEEYADESIPNVEAYHPKATARLRAYVAGDLYEGLMTADGHAVTKPLYQDIEAIGSDLYMCKTTNCDWLILNGKGEVVK